MHAYAHAHVGMHTRKHPLCAHARMLGSVGYRSPEYMDSLGLGREGSTARRLKRTKARGGEERAGGGFGALGELARVFAYVFQGTCTVIYVCINKDAHR